MVDFLNSLFQRGITLEDNLSGEIISVTLPLDGTEIKVPHRLKAVPKYRIILRQDNAAIVYDGATVWTDKFVTLKATGLATGGGGGTVTIPEISQTIGNVSNGFVTPNSTQWSTFVTNGANTFNTTGIKLPERVLSVSGGGTVTTEGEVTVTLQLLRG